jgi:hypothetical protein
VTFSFPNKETLKVEARQHGAGSLIELDATKNQFRCADGTLQIDAQRVDLGMAAIGTGFVGAKVLSLTRSGDGRLIVRRAETGLGFFLFVPIPGGSDDWYIFEPSRSRP